jgi:hypothetical protein
LVIRRAWFEQNQTAFDLGAGQLAHRLECLLYPRQLPFSPILLAAAPEIDAVEHGKPHPYLLHLSAAVEPR